MPLRMRWGYASAVYRSHLKRYCKHWANCKPCVGDQFIAPTLRGSQRPQTCRSGPPRRKEVKYGAGADIFGLSCYSARTTGRQTGGDLEGLYDDWAEPRVRHL